MQNDNPNEAQSLSQAESIYQHLLKGPITALEALKLYNCFRLSARIADIKKLGEKGGFIIHSKLIKIEGKKLAQYTLIKTEMIKQLKDVDFGKMCDMAAEFCQTFNAPKNIDLNATSLHQTFGFINSEVRELKGALKNNDVPETLDAYVDIAYFALTEAYKYGLLDSVKALAHSVSNNFQINFAYMPIEVAMGCLMEMIHGDKSKFPLAILNIVRSSAGMSRYLANFEAAFELVHKANMDKICSTEEEAKETVRRYFNQGVACFYERNAKDQFIVKRLSDKKILKRIGWQAPNLKPTIFGQ